MCVLSFSFFVKQCVDNAVWHVLWGVFFCFKYCMCVSQKCVCASESTTRYEISYDGSVFFFLCNTACVSFFFPLYDIVSRQHSVTYRLWVSLCACVILYVCAQAACVCEWVDDRVWHVVWWVSFDVCVILYMCVCVILYVFVCVMLYVCA